MKMMKWIMALLCVMALAACGGGGSSNSGSDPFPTDDNGSGTGTGTGTGTGGTTTSASIDVAISSTDITATTPATVTVTVKDADGKPVAGKVVNISTGLNLGVFSVDTILTGDDGVATAVLQSNSAGTAGADEVTATATVGNEELTGTVAFQVAGGGSGSAPTLDVSISATKLSAAAPATVTVLLTDGDGKPLAGQVVTISTSRQLATFSVATILTDSKGKASAALEVGSSGTAGADEVVATATVGAAVITGSVAYEVAAGGSTGNAASTVDVVASANRAGTGGGEITITAVVKNSGNVTLPGTAVRFSATTGSLAGAATVTDDSGAATARFSAGGDKSNRSAVITVTAGGASGKVDIAIDGTTLTFSGASTLLLGDTASMTVKATDSQGSAVAGLSLSVDGSLSNVADGKKITTDSTGVATLSYKAAVAGVDTLTISGAGATIKPKVTVSGQDFAFTSPAPGSTVKIGADGAVLSVRYRVNGAAPTGTFNVRFTTTAGLFSGTPAPDAASGIPLVSGVASARITSSFAGPATVQATVFSPSSPNVAVAQASLLVQFVAVTPASLVLQVSPSAIGPNTNGSTAQKADVQATVLDAFGNPVANVTVNFSRVSDPSGGNLSLGSAPTNSNGIATVQYIAGAQSTATDGVVLKGVVASKSSVSDQATLTVNQSALFIALGTGNVISNVNETTYRKQWTAYVTDSTGAAVPNVTLSISALPKQYGKGSFKWNGTLWATTNTAPVQSTLTVLPEGQSVYCPSEDVNQNGVLDAGEDVNGSKKLEPGNVISVNGGANVTTVQTDSTGFAIINLQYAESYAYWVQIGLKASATVAGTESSNEAVFWVPGSSEDYTVETVAPAGAVSPFGEHASCKAPN